jgi:hypothetical protein
MTKTRLLFVSLMLTAFACTEVNPDACANHPDGWCNTKIPGSTCQRSRGKDGKEVSRCVLDTSQDAGESEEAGANATVDAFMASDATVTPATDGPASADKPAEPADRPTTAGGDAADGPLTDAGADAPNCPGACNVGSKRCNGAGTATQECVMMGICPGWASDVACPASTACRQLGIAASCTCSASACVLGTQQCGPGGGLQTCTMTGSCTSWGSEVPCQGGQTCHPTSNSTAVCCANACSPGAQKCGATGVQTCVMNGACTAWGPDSLCQSPKTCQETGNTATCTCSGTSCTTGTMRCAPAGGATQTCISNGACTTWGSDSPCTTPTTCQQNGSSATCVCPSPAACTVGDKKCATATSAQQCVIGASGCAQWGTPMLCQAAPANASPVCSGDVCDFACNANYLRCRDATCGLAGRDFNSSVEGFGVSSSSVSFVTDLRQETFASRAVMTLKATLGNVNEAAIIVAPMCSQGGSVANKTITADVYIEGDPLGADDVSVGVALFGSGITPDVNGIPPCATFLGPSGGKAFCAVKHQAPQGVWTTIMSILPDTTQTDAITSIEFFMKFNGDGPWHGIVHVDNIRIK